MKGRGVGEVKVPIPVLTNLCPLNIDNHNMKERFGVEEIVGVF